MKLLSSTRSLKGYDPDLKSVGVSTHCQQDSEFEDLKLPFRKRLIRKRDPCEVLPKPCTEYEVKRFRVGKSKKTYRIRCYPQEALGISRRFQKKVMAAEMDNDADSDTEVINEQIASGFEALKQAVQAEKRLSGVTQGQ